MIDLKLTEYRIKEFKYQLKEGKIAIIKLFGGILDDIEIETIINEEPTEEPDYNPFSKAEDYDNVEKDNNETNKSVNEFDVKKFGKFILEYLKSKTPKEGEHPLSRKVKELHDYEPTSCLKSEKGMQETLDASRKKEWIENVKNNPSKPTETGNALIKDDFSKIKSLNELVEKIEDNRVTANLDKKYEDMTTGEKRQISKKLIEKDAKEDSDVIKERVEKAIGTNEPLSDELINAPEQRTYNEVPWTNKKPEKHIGKVPDVIKKVWEDDLKKKNVKENGE